MEGYVVRVTGRLDNVQTTWFQTTFSVYGTVTNLDRKEDAVYVTFDSFETAQAACREMDGETVSGDALHVELCSQNLGQSSTELSTDRKEQEEEEEEEEGQVPELPRRFSFKLDNVDTGSSSADTSDSQSISTVSMMTIPRQRSGSVNLFQPTRCGLDLKTVHSAMLSTLPDKLDSIPIPILTSGTEASEPKRSSTEKAAVFSPDSYSVEPRSFKPAAIVTGAKRKSSFTCPIETKKEGKYIDSHLALAGNESKGKGIFSRSRGIPSPVEEIESERTRKQLSPIKKDPVTPGGSQSECSLPRPPKKSKTQPLMISEVTPFIREAKEGTRISSPYKLSIGPIPAVSRTKTAPEMSVVTRPNIPEKDTYNRTHTSVQERETREPMLERRAKVKSPSPFEREKSSAAPLDLPGSSSSSSLTEENSENNPFKKALLRQTSPVSPVKRTPSPQPKVTKKAIAKIVSETIDCFNLTTKRILFFKHKSTLNILQERHRVMVRGEGVEGSALSITGEQSNAELVKRKIHALVADIKSSISFHTFTINCAFLPCLANSEIISSLQAIEERHAVSFAIITLDSQVSLTESYQSVKTKIAETRSPLSLSQVQGFVGMRVGYFWKARNVTNGSEVGFEDLNERINAAYVNRERTLSFTYKTHKYVLDFSQMTITDQTMGGEVHTLIREDPVWCRHTDDEFEFKPLRASISTIIESIFQQGAPGLITIEGKQCVIDFNSQPMLAYNTEGESCVIAREPIIKTESDLTPVVTLKVKGLAESLATAEKEFRQIIQEKLITQKVEIPEKIRNKVNRLLLCGIARQYCIRCNLKEDVLELLGEREIVSNIYGHLLQETLKIITGSETLNDGDVSGYPSHWEEQSKEVQLFPVVKDTSEWSHVEKLMKQSLASVKLVKLERIQNKELWQKYAFFQRAIQHKMQGKDINEKELFHGTRSNKPSVIYESEKGFDFRFGSSNCLWGQGSYFAVNASYSSSTYAYKTSDGKKQLILAKVVTGESKFMDRSQKMNFPPLKPGSTKERYDSIRAKTGGSEVYVIYDHEKAYPAYLITYQA